MLGNLGQRQDLSTGQISAIVEAILPMTDASYQAMAVAGILTNQRLSPLQKEILLEVVEDNANSAAYYYLLQNPDLPQDLVRKFFHSLQEKLIRDKMSTDSAVVPEVLFDYGDHENMQPLRRDIYGQYQQFRQSLEKSIPVLKGVKS